jgi:hypothetical protein
MWKRLQTNGLRSAHSVRWRRFIYSLRCRQRDYGTSPSQPDNGNAEEDYLAVHRPNLYWFPSKQPTAENDEREIGPYHKFPLNSSDLRQSAQFRTPDRPEYFDSQNRRSFGEAVPEEAEVQGMWMVDLEGDYSTAYMLSGMALFLGTMGGAIWWLNREHNSQTTWRRFAVDKARPAETNHVSSSSFGNPFWPIKTGGN